MGDVVNLNRVRKTKKRDDDSRKAEENRIRHGRSKAEKARDQAEVERLAKLLDGKKADE